MSHSLRGSPVFPKPPIERFKTWEEFEGSTPPVLGPKRDLELWALFDNDVYWPQPFIDAPPQMGELHEEVIGSYEAHYQRNGVVPAQKGDNSHSWLSNPVNIGAAGAMILFAFGGLLLIVNMVVSQ